MAYAAYSWDLCHQMGGFGPSTGSRNVGMPILGVKDSDDPALQTPWQYAFPEPKFSKLNGYVGTTSYKYLKDTYKTYIYIHNIPN